MYKDQFFHPIDIQKTFQNPELLTTVQARCSSNITTSIIIPEYCARKEFYSKG